MLRLASSLAALQNAQAHAQQQSGGSTANGGPTSGGPAQTLLRTQGPAGSGGLDPELVRMALAGTLPLEDEPGSGPGMPGGPANPGGNMWPPNQHSFTQQNSRLGPNMRNPSTSAPQVCFSNSFGVQAC